MNSESLIVRHQDAFQAIGFGATALSTAAAEVSMNKGLEVGFVVALLFAAIDAGVETHKYGRAEIDK